MARPRYCSAEGCESEATVLITFLESGNTLDWCDGHFGSFVVQSAAEIGMVFPAEDEDAGDVAPAPAGEAPESAPESGPAAEEGTPAGDERPAGALKGVPERRRRQHSS